MQPVVCLTVKLVTCLVYVIRRILRRDRVSRSYIKLSKTLLRYMYIVWPRSTALSSSYVHTIGLETLNRRRVIFDLILSYKYLHGLVEINNCNFIRIHQSSRTRGNGMKLYKEHCSIDVRHQFFSNRIVDIWNSAPAAVVLSPVWLFLNKI